MVPGGRLAPPGRGIRFADVVEALALASLKTTFPVALVITDKRIEKIDGEPAEMSFLQYANDLGDSDSEFFIRRVGELGEELGKEESEKNR